MSGIWKSEGFRWFSRLYPLGFLLLAVAHIRSEASERLVGDEWRYLWYARNILAGFYTPRDNEMIWNGPGYPLILTPFLALDAPAIAPKLANAVFFALAIFLVHRTLLLYCSRARATLGGMVLGLSPMPYQFLHLVFTESISVMLVAATAYFFCASRRKRGHAHAVTAGVCLGALILVKVSFGPSTLFALAVAAALYALRRRTRTVERALVTCSVAFALCIPWLWYTHDVSGKWLYWSSGGGSLLYWMTSPYPEELGDWFHHNHVKNVPFLNAHHAAVFEKLKGDPSSVAGTDLERMMPGVGRLCSVASDAEMWRIGFRQLLAHPLLYLRNWGFNVTRLFFNFPYTLYTDIDPRLVVLHFSMLAGVILVLVRRLRKDLWLPPQLEAIGLFTFLCTGIATGLGAVGRYFFPLYPLYLLLALAGTAPERARPRTREARAKNHRRLTSEPGG